MLVSRSVVGIVVAAFATSVLIGSLANPGPSHAQSSVCPANPDPVDQADPAITLEHPSDRDEVTSPLRVSGEARVFEANVSIVLLDSEGTALVETFAMADAGAPEKAPFEADVDFTVDSSQQGSLQVFEASAQDGSPTNVVQVELVLAADGTTATPAPPATGSSEADGATSESLPAASPVLVVAILGLAVLMVITRSAKKTR